MAKFIVGEYYRLTDSFGCSVLYRAISDDRLKPANTPIGRFLSEYQPDMLALSYSGLRVELVPNMSILGDELPESE